MPHYLYSQLVSNIYLFLLEASPTFIILNLSPIIISLERLMLLTVSLPEKWGYCAGGGRGLETSRRENNIINQDVCTGLSSSLDTTFNWVSDPGSPRYAGLYPKSTEPPTTLLFNHACIAVLAALVLISNLDGFRSFKQATTLHVAGFLPS